MRSVFLLLCLLPFIQRAAGQSLKLLQNGTVISGTTITVNGSSSDVELMVEHIALVNSSANTLQVKLKRYEVSYIPSTYNSMCWNGHCEMVSAHQGGQHYFYALSDVVSLSDTNTTFSGHYRPNGQAGASEYCYVFYNVNNPLDSTFLNVIYNATDQNAVAEYGFDDCMKVYPNPASDRFVLELNTTTSEEAVLNIYNSVGQLVGAQSQNNLLMGKNTLNLNIELFSDGFYTVSVVFKNGIHTTKLIVNHSK